MVSGKDFVKEWIPAATFSVAFVTLATTLTITLASGQYIGGIPWPYFSDTGRERTYGQYYIFSLGLTAAAGLWLGVQVGLWHWFARAIESFQTSPHVQRCRVVGVVTGALAAPFLPTLAWFDTVNFPTVHNAAAYAFFVFAVSAVTCFTIAFSLVAKSSDVPHPTLVRSVRIKRVVAAVLAIAFVIYIPIGLSTGCSFERLSIANCEKEGMSTHYCASTVRKDDKDTLLWDYSACPVRFSTSAISQHVCVLSILTFIGTVFLDFKHQDSMLGTPVPDPESPVVPGASIEMPV